MFKNNTHGFIAIKVYSFDEFLVTFGFSNYTLGKPQFWIICSQRSQLALLTVAALLAASFFCAPTMWRGDAKRKSEQLKGINTWSCSKLAQLFAVPQDDR